MAAPPNSPVRNLGRSLLTSLPTSIDYIFVDTESQLQLNDGVPARPLGQPAEVTGAAPKAEIWLSRYEQNSGA